MDKKMKQCFEPHTMMHSLFGLGLGVLLATLVPSVRLVWFGVAIAGVAFVLDVMRK